MKNHAFPIIFVSGWVALAAFDSVQAQAKPGSVSNVTLALSVTTEEPDTFMRDVDGRFVLDSDGKKIPFIDNRWQTYDAAQKTLVYNGELKSKLLKKRYSNKQFLTDLISKGIIAGPVQGWSLQYVTIALYDEFGDFEGQLSRYFAVKKGLTPVRLPREVFWMSPNVTLRKTAGKWTSQYRNVSDPDPISEDRENWELVSESESYKDSGKSLMYVESTIGASVPIDIPWFDKEVHMMRSMDMVDARTELATQAWLVAVSSTSQGKVKPIRISGETFRVWTPGTQRVTASAGEGPAVLVREIYIDDEERLWEWSSSIMEGKITISAGTAKNLQAYPGLEWED